MNRGNINRGNVNRNVNRNVHVNVNRGVVRPWARRPWFGTVVAGVTLGTIIAATTVPVAPEPVLVLDQFIPEPGILGLLHASVTSGA